MKCPKCGAKSSVQNTIFKKDFTIRYRRCLNKNCKNRFKTMEQVATGWDYRSIVKQMKDMLREVKV